MPSIHLNDFGVSRETSENFIKKPVCKELGQGNLELKSIIKEAKRAGCEWYIIETQDNWVDSDPFKSIKISFEHLKKIFCNL